MGMAGFSPHLVPHSYCHCESSTENVINVQSSVPVIVAPGLDLHRAAGGDGGDGRLQLPDGMHVGAVDTVDDVTGEHSSLFGGHPRLGLRDQYATARVAAGPVQVSDAVVQ